MLLSEAVAAYLAARGLRLSPATISDYSLTFKRLQAFLGDVQVAEVNAGDLRRFIASHPVGNKTKLNMHTALASLWTWLVSEHHVAEHVVRRVEPPRPEMRVIRPFERGEVVRLLDAACNGRQPGRDRAILLTLADTGIRASELCGLRVRDLLGEELRVQGKGNRERLTPISTPVIAAIRAQLCPTAGASAPLFSSRKGGPLSRDGLKQLIKRLACVAGVNDAHPHRFRHTFAITFLRNGGDIYSLQRILGHSSLEMVKRYLAIAQTDIHAAHRRASPVTNWGIGQQMLLDF